jgi:hypothetical protein
MNNIIRFPRKPWTPKPKSFYKFVMPARVIAITIAVALVIGLLTAVAGPAAFLIMAVVFMIYTMMYLP